MALRRRALEMALLACLIHSAALRAQEPPPPPSPQHTHPARPGAEHDVQRIQQQIAAVRKRLETEQPVPAEGSELIAFSKRYLDAAQDALRAGRFFVAQRLADAADDCRRPIDHLMHLTEERPTPPLPPDLGDRLKRIYFRLRLCDYFLQEIPSPKPKRLLALARHFYEEAVRAQAAEKLRAADEYAKSADDLTHALENLAQAYLPETRPAKP